MLAYRKNDFDALARSEAVSRWAKDKLVEESSGKSLSEKFPSPFYTPNEFIRIGLFIFATIGAMAAAGLFFLMTGSASSETGVGAYLIVFGAGMAFLLEMLVRKEKPFYRAGAEEALLYGALICLVSGILVLIKYHHEPGFALASLL